MRTTLILPDIQWPDCDMLMLKKVISVAKELQPDAILQIGDAIDFPQVSQWNKGRAGEFATDLQDHIDGWRKVMENIREVCPKSQITWLEGNHDLRIQDFLKKYAAPVTSLRVLEMPALFGLDELSIKYTRGLTLIAPGTYAAHGHESGGYAASPSAWDMKFMKRYGSDKSFVFGHTHSPFLISRAFGYEGKVSPRFTMNVGSIMDPVKATYVKDGAVSWTMSFGVIHDDGKRVYPELVLATDRGFMFQGKKW